jgi:hypothetical protein
MKVKYQLRRPDGTKEIGMVVAKSYKDAFNQIDQTHNPPNETRIDFCKMGSWKFTTTFIVRHLK